MDRGHTVEVCLQYSSRGKCCPCTAVIFTGPFTNADTHGALRCTCFFPSAIPRKRRTLDSWWCGDFTTNTTWLAVGTASSEYSRLQDYCCRTPRKQRERRGFVHACMRAYAKETPISQFVFFCFSYCYFGFRHLLPGFYIYYCHIISFFYA